MSTGFSRATVLQLFFILVTDEMLVKDSELKNEIEAMDEEEQSLIDEEIFVLEELKNVSEKHRSMMGVYDKVVNNLSNMTKISDKTNPKENTYDESVSKEREEEYGSDQTNSLISDYEVYLASITEKLNQITSSYSKTQFEQDLKEKGYLEYGKIVKLDRSFVNDQLSNKQVMRAKKQPQSYSLEYVFDDPDVKNEDKTIQDETDILIEENKMAIYRKREEVMEGIKERKK